MIKQLESSKSKLVFYYQPDGLNADGTGINEYLKINLNQKHKREYIKKIIISPLYLLNKLGVNLQLVDDSQSYLFQSQVQWPTPNAKSPVGYSMLLIKTEVNLPYQPQEIVMNYDYSGDANLICCADCLETSAIIVIEKGENLL